MWFETVSGIYCGPAPVPAELWLRWNLDPLVLSALALLAWVVRRSPPGLAAVGVLAVAFVSPLCALSAALFSARVVHHVLLVAVAAPLLAIAWPPRRPASVGPAFLIFTATLWGWHWPAAYDLALSNMAIYWVMQLTLLASALAFWRGILDVRTGGRAVVPMLAGYMQMAFLGALLTFAPEPLYAIHTAAPLAWGFVPPADQQLGGLIMWGPAGLPFLLFGAWVARREWRALGTRPA